MAKEKKGGINRQGPLREEKVSLREEFYHPLAVKRAGESLSEFADFIIKRRKGVMDVLVRIKKDEEDLMDHFLNLALHNTIEKMRG